jgi:hypothetical protein
MLNDWTSRENHRHKNQRKAEDDGKKSTGPKEKESHRLHYNRRITMIDSGTDH